MRLKSFLRKFFLGGEVLEKVYSPINGEILVVEDLFGRRQMRIGKVDQSGGLAEKLWREIFNLKSCLSADRFEIFNEKPSFKCLILGLGSGTVASLIANRYSSIVKITGVEIDPLVVDLGKKYFGLDKIPNLEIVVKDAIEFVGDSRFDLIIVDLYLGQEYPKEAESKGFFVNLKKILNKQGLIIINRLYFNNFHQKKTESFFKCLKEIYPKVKTQRILTNMLFYIDF